MRKYIYISALILAMATTFAGCNRKNQFGEADFVATVTDISITVNGTSQFTYDKKIHQIAWDNGKKQFRVMDDDLDNYYVVTLESMPSQIGDIVNLSLTYTTDTDIIQHDGTFSVSNIQDSQSAKTIWLWDSNGGIGIVMQELH